MLVLTVAEILAAIEQLAPREQQELSQVVLNLPINIKIGDRVYRSSPDDAQTSKFWERVERFRYFLQTAEAEIDVSEIWEDVRDRSPGREVDVW